MILLAEDPDGNSINWEISTAPIKGTAVISSDSSPGTSKTISYIPQAGATGADSFVVTIDDGTGFTSSMTVNVTIAFTVSVTVSGYTTGNTMVLQINGKNDLLVLADGTFTFSDTLDSGDRYEVTNSPFSSILKTSCLFNNASGEIINSNITNVAVICADDIAPNIVSITPDAGTTGVALDSSISVVFDEDLLASSIGTDAVLLSDTLGSVPGTINYNVSNRTLSIVPTEPLALFRPYTVTLSPEITDIAGQAIVSNPWTFRTRDGTWGVARTIEETISQDRIFERDFEMNSTRHGLLVWRQTDGEKSNIWASYHDSNTDKWGVAELIEDENQQDAGSPIVALDSVGNGFVVWQQRDSERKFTIWANRFDVSSKNWGEAKLISNIGPGNVGSASYQIALNSVGQGIVIWRYTDVAQIISVWANRFDSETKTWRGAELVTNDSQLRAISPQISLDSFGKGFAAWDQKDSTGRLHVWAKRFDFSNSEWGTAELIDSDNQLGASPPQIATNSAGQSIVTWKQFGGILQYSVWANHFDLVTKKWGIAKRIENDAHQGSGSPKIAINSAGMSIVIWTQYDGQNNHVWANHFDPVLKTWDVPELIGTEKEGNVSSYEIALNASGLGVAVWEEYDGIGMNSWTNRFDPNTKTWGTAELIQTHDQLEAYGPKISLDVAGKGIAIWGQYPDLGIGENRFE